MVILGGTAIGVGAGLYLGIGSFAKKLWHDSARAMLETYFGRSSKNASIDNKPQAADSDTPKAQTPDNKTQTPDSDTPKAQTPDNKTQTPDNSADGKTNSASSDALKPNASTEKINEADNTAKIRANMANAVNNSTLTINGSTINLKGDSLAKYNDLQNKIEALSNDPKNIKLQSEMQKSFNNFYYSVDPEGKIITKNVRAQIVQDINNSKIPSTMDEFIQYLSKSVRSVL